MTRIILEINDSDKIVTKKGNVLTVAEYNSWTRKQFEAQKAERMRNYKVIRNLYFDYMADECDDKSAREQIRDVNGYSMKSINVALNTGKMNAIATVEFSAKALVLQEKEEAALEAEIEHIDSLIAEALVEDTDKRFNVKGKSGAREIDDIDWLPRDEYIMRLNQMKRKAIKDTVDSLKVFKNDNTNVNVIVTQDEHAKRMKDVAGKFGIEITSDYEVKDDDA